MCPLFKFFRMINGYFDVTIDACNGGLSQAIRALRFQCNNRYIAWASFIHSIVKTTNPRTTPNGRMKCIMETLNRVLNQKFHEEYTARNSNGRQSIKHCRRSLDGQTMYNSYHKPQNTMLTCPKNTRKNIAELCRITRLQPASGLMRNNSKVRVELT